MTLEGCDVVTVRDDLIKHNDAYIDSGDVARQLGLLPPAGSRAEARLTKLANARTQLLAKINGVDTEPIADGVWVVRGGFPLKTMNVYLIEDGEGVVVFDAGIEAMGRALRAACARLGGTKRVVLGHADADHRGAAPALGAPVYCHPAERAAAESQIAVARLLGSRQARSTRPPSCSQGCCRPGTAARSPCEGTIAEGDEVAGFRVIDLPGHAPGLIGLFRESDRLALVSDCVYTLDLQTGRKRPVHDPASRLRRRRRAGARLDPQARRARALGRLGRSRRPGHRRRERPAARGRGGAALVRRAGSWVVVTASAPSSNCRRTSTATSEGNVLALRGSLTAGARTEYAQTLASGHHREDARQRATELLFERLAVSWTIAGLTLERQKELLGRYRMASAHERAFVRDSLRAHVDEHFPELEAP